MHTPLKLPGKSRTGSPQRQQVSSHGAEMWEQSREGFCASTFAPFPIQPAVNLTNTDLRSIDETMAQASRLGSYQTAISTPGVAILPEYCGKMGKSANLGKGEEMQQATLTVAKMSCAHCQATIEKTGNDLAGVSQITADPASKKVDVTFDETTVSLDEIKQTLAAAGYPAE